MARPRDRERESSSLRFEDFDVAVTSSERGDLGWLEAFLACGFEPVAAGACDRRVALTVDAAAYDRLFAMGQPGQRRAGGRLREGREALPARTLALEREAIASSTTRGGRSST